MVDIVCSGNPMSELNVARRRYALARETRRLANKGLFCKSSAARIWNRYRADLKRAVNGTRPAHRHDPHFKTTISGIPCGIVVESVTPAKPWRQHTFSGAGPGDCDPPEPAECEWFVVDRLGYPAEWLEEKMTQREQQEIDSMVEKGGV